MSKTLKKRAIHRIPEDVLRARFRLTPEGDLEYKKKKPGRGSGYFPWAKDTGNERNRTSSRTREVQIGITVDGRLVKVLRSHIVYFLKTGKYPKVHPHEINHIDGDSMNDHPDNIEEISREEHQAHTREGRRSTRRGDNTTGYPNISVKNLKSGTAYQFHVRRKSTTVAFKYSKDLDVCRRAAWAYWKANPTYHEYTDQNNPWWPTEPEELFVPRRVCTKTGVVLTIFDMAG